MKPTGPQSPDADLVLAVLAGRQEAFDVLVGRYQKRATSVSYRLVGSVHDALEVTQDAFLKAYRRLDTLTDPDRFGPWLLRIVTNLSLNYRRNRSHRAVRISLDDCVQRDSDAAIDPPAPAHSDVDPTGRAQARELGAALETEIAALSEQQRTALVLFSVEQLPQREVAEIMGCSVEAVKWHVFQARKKLRERLGDYFETPAK